MAKWKLSAIRNNMQLTQGEMADKLEISRSSYISFEKDPLKAPVEIILKISLMSGVPMDSIDYGV